MEIKVAGTIKLDELIDLNDFDMVGSIKVYVEQVIREEIDKKIKSNRVIKKKISDIADKVINRTLTDFNLKDE